MPFQFQDDEDMEEDDDHNGSSIPSQTIDVSRVNESKPRLFKEGEPFESDTFYKTPLQREEVDCGSTPQARDSNRNQRSNQVVVKER